LFRRKKGESMTPLWWMVAVSVLSWLGAAAIVGDAGNPEVMYGMGAPLLAAAGTWIVTVITHRSRPERVTNVLIGGLAVKAVFFAGYVVVMLRVLDVRPRPFVISFTAYFIALYGMEALFLRRLFAGRMPAPRT
jgi:hypothetical protein